jgi:hypothetical protein
MNVDDYARLYSLTWDITRYPYSVGTARGKRYPSPNGDWPDEDLPGEPGWKPESTAPYATLAEAVRDAEAIPARRGLTVDVCYYDPARAAAPLVAYRIHCEPWRDANGCDLASLSDIHVEES